MGGTPQRMESFAYYIAEQIGERLPPDGKLKDFSEIGQRYSMYKVGPVLSVSVSEPPTATTTNLLSLMFL